jgi:hypothetical protein
MKQSEIAALLNEAAESSEHRRLEIKGTLLKCVIPGEHQDWRNQASESILSNLWDQVVMANPKGLPRLDWIIVLLCGDREEGAWFANIDFSAP